MSRLSYIARIATLIWALLFLFACRSSKINEVITTYRDTTFVIQPIYDTIIVKLDSSNTVIDTTHHGIVNVIAHNDSIRIVYITKPQNVRIDSAITYVEKIKYKYVTKVVNKCDSRFHKYLEQSFYTFIGIFILYVIFRLSLK